MRFAALCLLLFMAIDLTSICSCEDEPFDLGGSTAVQMTALASSHSTDDTDFAHECFCCCRRIRPEQTVHVLIELPLVEVVQEYQPHRLTVAAVPPYHPPRSISL